MYWRYACYGYKEGETSASTNRIHDGELTETMVRTVKGEYEATLLLVRHFSIVYEDYDTVMTWNIIDAENDYQEAQYSLVVSLLNNKNDNESITRSIFWLYKMAAIGYRKTKECLFGGK